MPLRLRMRPPPGPRDMSPISARYEFDMPDIEDSDSFRVVVEKLSLLVFAPCFISDSRTALIL